MNIFLRSQHDKNAEFMLLLEVMGVGDLRIGALPVRPLTAAKWAFLWMLDNPFVNASAESKSEEKQRYDADVFLYVISAPDIRKLDCSFAELPGKASGMSRATGLDSETVRCEIITMIRTAFSPMSMLPPKPDDGESAKFDAEWLTRLCSVAARESGENIRYCMHEMSLSAVCCHYVEHYRKNSLDGDKVGRRPSIEIMMEIEARTDELAKEFLSQK